MPDYRASIRKVLITFERTSSLGLLGGSSASVAALRDELAQKYLPAPKGYFNNRFHATLDEELSMVGEGQYLYLKPPEDHPEVIPVMAIEAQVSKDHARLKVELALFKLHGKLEAIGYRFEYGLGAHNMLHCQHIDGFRAEYGSRRMRTEAIPVQPQWLPTTQPSFPLDGNGAEESHAVSALLAAYVSLYGLTQLKSIASSLPPNTVKMHPNYFR